MVQILDKTLSLEDFLNLPETKLANERGNVQMESFCDRLSATDFPIPTDAIAKLLCHLRGILTNYPQEMPKIMILLK
jgi:hypothetical protein